MKILPHPVHDDDMEEDVFVELLYIIIFLAVVVVVARGGHHGASDRRKLEVWRFTRQIENQERPPRKTTGRVRKRTP